MVAASDEPGSSPLQCTVDKSAVQRLVPAMLDGSGLKVQALKYELVITNPRVLENGQVRIKYTTGHVSRKHPFWEQWGPLQGYQAEGNDAEPYASADKIISTLRKNEKE